MGLSSKKRPELEEMLDEIKQSMKGGGGDGMDTQFFDAVAEKLPLYMAKADIEEVHDKANERVAAWRKAGGGKKDEKEGYETKVVNSDDDVSIADGDITGGEEEDDELEPLENHNEDGAFSPIL